jgi:hypothetical protein
MSFDDGDLGRLVRGLADVRMQQRGMAAHALCERGTDATPPAAALVKNSEPAMSIRFGGNSLAVQDTAEMDHDRP